MEYLVGRWSFAEVSKAVLAFPAADKSTHQCFDGKTEALAVAALQDKVAQLRPHCGGVLSALPFDWVP
jgi:hypothetical protein